MRPQLLPVLAEQNRFNIVELLHKHPRTVNEIAGILKMQQPQTSKHLRVLAEAGVVEITPIANQRLYALKPQAFQELDIWLEKYRALWHSR